MKHKKQMHSARANLKARLFTWWRSQPAWTRSAAAAAFRMMAGALLSVLGARVRDFLEGILQRKR